MGTDSCSEGERAAKDHGATVKQPDTADRKLVDTEVGNLSWVAPPNPSECGCVWRRCSEFGDVVTSQCFDHAIETVMGTLTEIAREVARNRKTPEEVADKVAAECTLLGPNVVQTLDRFFESEVTRIRYGKDRAP